MAQEIEFSSPYGYIAAKRIEALAEKHGRTIAWKPFLLGAVFKEEGTQSLISYPSKGPYSKRDIERTAAYYELPFTWPPSFPILTVNAARAVLWAQKETPDLAVPLIQRLYDMIFAEGRDIAHVGPVAEAASEVGLAADAVSAGLKSPAIKAVLKATTDEAIARGVFGSPFLFIDEEPFWGNDRLDMADAWMSRGGW